MVGWVLVGVVVFCAFLGNTLIAFPLLHLRSDLENKNKNNNVQANLLMWWRDPGPKVWPSYSSASKYPLPAIKSCCLVWIWENNETLARMHPIL